MATEDDILKANQELNATLQEMKKLQEERMKLEEQKAAEEAQKAREAVDKESITKLADELKKDQELKKKLNNLTVEQLKQMTEGPLAELVAGSKKTAEQLSLKELSQEQLIEAALQATEKQDQERAARQKQRDENFLATTARVLGGTAFGKGFLETPALLGTETRAQMRRGKAMTAAERGEQFDVWVQQMSDRLSKIGKKLSDFKDIVTDPKKLAFWFGKTTATLMLRIVVLPITRLLFTKVFSPLSGALGKLAGTILSVPQGLKSIGNLFRRSERIRDPEAARAAMLGGLKKVEEIREKRRSERQAANMKTVSDRLREVPDRILKSRGMKRLFGVGKLLLIAIPLILGAVIFIREFLKSKAAGMFTGEAIQEAIGEVFTRGFQVTTLGMVPVEELREKVREPFVDFTRGVTNLIFGMRGLRTGMAMRDLEQTGEGIVGLVSAPFDIAFRVGTELVEKTARLFGGEDYAKRVDEAFKDFNLGDFIISGIDVATKGWVDTIERFKRGEAWEDAKGSMEQIGKDFTSALASWVTEMNPFLDEEEKERVKKQLRGEVTPAAPEVKQQYFEGKQRLQEALLGTPQDIAAEEARLENVITQLKRGLPQEYLETGVMRRDGKDIVDSGHLVLIAHIDAQERLLELLRSRQRQIPQFVAETEDKGALMMEENTIKNAELKQKAMGATNVSLSPTNQTNVSNPATPATVPVPMSMRNNENSLTRQQDRDYQGAMP